MNTFLCRSLTCVFWLILVSGASAFYDPHIGRWINRDPIAENGGENVYGFLNNAPIDDTDDLGLQPQKKRQQYNLGFRIAGKTEDKCGEFLLALDFQISPTATTGYVIQRVHYKADITNENGSKNDKSKTMKWREAFSVPGTMTDLNGEIAHDKTKGTVTFFFDATYHANMQLDGDWHPGGYPNPTLSGSLPWNDDTYVPWNPINRGDSNHLIRRIKVSWDCRCTSTDRKTKLEASP